MDVPTSYYGTPAYRNFKQLHSEIFDVESKVRELGFEQVRLALYRSRIELGYAEHAHKMAYARKKQQEEEQND